MSNMGAFLLASFMHNDAWFCMSPVSNECPREHRLVWAATSFRILLGVWPSATACRAQSDVFDSESQDWSRWLGALSHPLSYTPGPRQWHTRICSAVEGRQDATCENCAWGAGSWASEIQRVIRSWADSGRQTSARPMVIAMRALFHTLKHHIHSCIGLTSSSEYAATNSCSSPDETCLFRSCFSISNYSHNGCMSGGIRAHTYGKCSF